MLTAPTLALRYNTPYNLLAEASGPFDAEAISQITWQVSLSSSFATVLETVTDSFAAYTYAISSGNRSANHYVRAKTSDGTLESDWSATLTVIAIAAPSAPTLTLLAGSPQRIAVGTTVPTTAGYVVMQVSRTANSATRWDSGNIVHERRTDRMGYTETEYRVPSDQRTTTHYVRGKLGFVADFDPATGEELLWESAWSSDLTASSGLVASDDISEIEFSKVRRSVATGGGDWVNVGDLEAFLDLWEVGDATGAFAGYIRSSALLGAGGYLSVAKSGQSVGTSTLTDSTALQFDASSGTAYRFDLNAVINWDGASDMKFALRTPTLDGGIINLAYATTTSTTSADLPAPTSYRVGNNFGTITQTAATGMRYTHIRINGLLMIPSSGGGTVALQFAANTVPGGVWVIPTLEDGSYITWQEF